MRARVQVLAMLAGGELPDSGRRGVSAGEGVNMPQGGDNLSRRDLLSLTVRSAGLLALGGVLGNLAARSARGETVWQIDHSKCNQCGKCATECVLTISAVKCVNAFDLCGYCDLCTGYFLAQPNALNTGAENQVCPTAALKRKFIEDPYYEYVVDPELCIGCGKCVTGCYKYGNGSLILQIDQHRCVRCNSCSIAVKCPTLAITRRPARESYQLPTQTRTG
jgi:electron transport complex protein RnfB